MRHPLVVVLLASLVSLLGCGRGPMAICCDVPLYAIAVPRVIPVTGGVSTITARVVDERGRPVPDGTRVHFSTALGEVTPEARTHDAMVAATLASDGRPGTATVAAAPEVGLRFELTVEVVSATLLLGASQGALPPGGGSVELEATVYDVSGAPEPGVTVTFSTDRGQLGSDGHPLLTDAGGRAVDRLTTGETATVTATAGSRSDSTEVVVVR